MPRNPNKKNGSFSSGSNPDNGGGNSNGGGNIDSGPLQAHNTYFYDFGTPTSPVLNGYTAVSERNTDGFYRWNSNAAEVKSVDRGTASGQNEINRDLNYAGIPKTFVHQLPNGDYDIQMTFIDTGAAHDNIRVKAEGINKLTNIQVTQGNKVDRIISTTVSDGELNLEFRDTGGSDPNWVVTRIMAEKL